MPDLKNSKVYFKILCILGAVIAAALIFSAGVAVGFRKASFGQAWEENYEHNFGPRPGHFMSENFPNAGGAVGKIVKVSLPSIIVADKTNTEKVVLLTDDTQIEEMRIAATSASLKLDDFVVVIGTPNLQGQIEAKFIRIMPSGLPAAPSPIQ